MARPNTKSRTAAALILLGVLAAVFASLGNWQLHRAAERLAIRQAIQGGRNSAPLQLESNTPHKELLNWRAATASGTWLDTYTVLVENRNFKGRPGFWVATPLLIAPETHTAVLVLRGWLPRPIEPGVELPPIPTPGDRQTIKGELVNRVPRVFELWSFGRSQEGRLPAQLPAPGNKLPRVQNLDLAAYAKATGLKLMPSVLEQTSDSNDGLGRQWPQPSLDADRNTGYALQWFSFAGIALTALLAIAWRAWHPRKPRA